MKFDIEPIGGSFLVKDEYGAVLALRHSERAALEFIRERKKQVAVQGGNHKGRYGKELILDLHGCDAGLFTREALEKFFVELCDFIHMERCDLHFWDYEDDPEGYANAPAHLKGVSAIQFITTSNITIHTLEELGKVFLNIFSCKNFDADEVAGFSSRYFKGRVANHVVADRI